MMEYVSQKNTKNEFQNYINNLGSIEPNKGKNMNDTPNTTAVDTPAIEVVRHYYVDADGNEVELPFNLSDGEAASEETAFIAEDYAGTPITVH